MQSGGGWGAAFRQLAAGVLITLSTASWAQTPHVKIGLVLSLTGPAASLGIPARDTVALLPKEMGGRPVDYIILDDASDTTQAVQTTKKLISEDHVDAIIDYAELARHDRCGRRRPDPDDLARVVIEDH